MSPTNRIVEAGLEQNISARVIRLRVALRKVAEVFREHQRELRLGGVKVRSWTWMALGKAEFVGQQISHAGELLDFVREELFVAVGPASNYVARPLFGDDTPCATAVREVYDAANDLAVAYKAVLANA